MTSRSGRPPARRFPAALVAPGPGPRGPPATGDRRAQPSQAGVRRRLVDVHRAADRHTRRGRHRDAGRPRRRPRHPPLARDRTVADAPPDRSSTSPGSTRVGRAIRRSARPGAPTARLGRFGRPRPEGLEAPRSAGAGSPGPPRRGRRRPARPALGDRLRARPAGRHPRGRPGRLLRAARPDERALGGAPRSSGLALLADPAGRRARRSGLPAVRRAAGGLRAHGVAPPRTPSSAPVGCAAEDLDLVGRLLDAGRHNVDIAARLGRRRQPYSTVPSSSVRGSDPVRGGHGREPDVYRIHYAIGSMSHSTTAEPSGGAVGRSTGSACRTTSCAGLPRPAGSCGWRRPATTPAQPGGL